MARACRFTTPYSSREIYHDGKPFITIHRPVNEHGNGPRPTDVDEIARQIKQYLCGEKRGRSNLGAGFFKNLFKKKAKPRVGDKTIYWFPHASSHTMVDRNPYGAMTKRGHGVMGGARKRRRRRR